MADQRMKICFMVMQDVNHQLFTESVIEEVLISMSKDAMDLEGSSRVDAILEEMDLLDSLLLAVCTLCSV